MMETQLQIIKDLVKKYPNDYQLGSMVRRFITEEYWKLPKKELERKLKKAFNLLYNHPTKI